MKVSPPVVGLLALIALVPLGIYLIDSGQADVTSAALTGLNVVLIAGSLFFMFGDAPTDSQHVDGAAQ